MSSPELSCLAVLLMCRVLHDEVIPAKEIIVHLVEGNSGNPAKDQYVVLFAGDPRDPRRRAPSMVKSTSADGRVHFSLSEPLPDEIWIDPGYQRFITCSEGGFYRTADVLKSGITGKNTCRGKKALEEVMAKPGEIVIYVRRLTFWETMQR